VHAPTWLLSDRQPTPQPFDPIAQPVEPCDGARFVNGDLEGDDPLFVSDRHARVCPRAGVLERFETAPVDGDRDRRRTPRSRRNVEVDADTRARGRRAECHSEAARLEQRWVDPMRKPCGFVESALHVALQLVE
jgi:hypothetical protein